MHAPPRPRPAYDRHGNPIKPRRSVASRLREANPDASDDGIFRAARAVHKRLREQGK